eukprot:TRINITY_DN62523_c0_g1_i2.p1 TRINITY_DN62523_c0_g1~~TRINITY_DN62523_c0_g1_i2.p1  ORF type:complete len:501 (-),score=72.91 TRINITY_DN62523_c0_g1_i2:225-1727(-)
MDAASSEDVCCLQTLDGLPEEALVLIFEQLLPQRLRSVGSSWLPLVRLASTGCALQSSLGRTLVDNFPASLSRLKVNIPAARRTCWLQLLASFNACNASSWESIRTLSAVRPRGGCWTPQQHAPRLSGCSLCAVGEGRLLLFGGRESVSGNTEGAAWLISVTRSVVTSLVTWDKLEMDGPAPPSRCYHSATRWTAAEPANSGGRFARVVIFGGSGSAGGVLNDTWCLTLSGSRVDGSAGYSAEWQELHQAAGSAAPVARSSHICALWTGAGGGTPVLQGGLGDSGTYSDTWLLTEGCNAAGQADMQPGGLRSRTRARTRTSSNMSSCSSVAPIDPAACWTRLETLGPPVARAHHVGGVVSDMLLLVGGHDTQLLTVDWMGLLHLPTATWSTVKQPGWQSARIDASAVSLGDDLGLLVFGGVGPSYEFEEATPWLVSCARDGAAKPLVGRDPSKVPRRRACAALCSDGLRVYAVGGFDGQNDLNDLWCLSLLPSCFANCSV